MLLRLLLLFPVLLAVPARAEVPFPRCDTLPGCVDPADYASYLKLDPALVDLTDTSATGYPNDFNVDPGNANSGDSWKFLANTGMDILGAWETTTGRPDVVSAILDSGIRWNSGDLVRKIALNLGELPLPDGCAEPDCNGDGIVNVDDWVGGDCDGTPISDQNDTGGVIDAQDLIELCSDGVDDDGNGYVDDIAGWDFQDDDNDAFDRVDYGHGTGEGNDGMAEAHNGGGFPGVAPSSMFVPLKVADSFVAIDSDFQQAVVYAVDLGVDIISEALGTINSQISTQDAIDYAYARGVPIIASAADEESRHHNWPAAYGHTIWVNSMVHGDGTIVEETDQYDILNGCTNYSGKAWVSIPSNSCSSEATGRANGLVSLLVAHGKNLIDRGELAPYPGTGQPFSAEEIRQMLRRSAEDVDHSGDLSLSMAFLVRTILSGATPETTYLSRRFPSQPGFEQYFGYGRPHAPTLLSVTQDTIPPEADLSGGLPWFGIVDPVRTPQVDVVGSVAAMRAPGMLTYTVEAACGVSPLDGDFVQIGGGASLAPMHAAVLASWDPAQTAADCGLDPTARPGDPGVSQDPDLYTATLRLRVTDSLGNQAEDRRSVAIHTDATQRFAPRHIGASGEGSPVLVDLDRDGDMEIVYGSGDGAVHAFRGDDGEELPGFPVYSDPVPVHLSPGYADGHVPVPHEGIIGPVAAGDIDGDGRPEIVAASIEGKLYVWNNHGVRLPGFPVTTDPALSDPANRDRKNDTDPGIISAPTLADLDGPDGEPMLEIVHGAFDGHVYAWRADGSPVSGFPVRLADATRVSVDPVTGTATPITDGVEDRGAKVLGSPAVGDLDGDGYPEIVASTTEEYVDQPGPGGEDPPPPFASDSALVGLLLTAADQLGFDDFSVDTQGRTYAIHHDGNDHAGGPFLPGWPVKIPLLAPGLLPTVGTGTPGAAALADLDGNGTLTTAIFGVGGPVMLFEPDGTPRFDDAGIHVPLALDFPAPGFPFVPASAGSPDSPFFGAIGSGSFGDITGDGAPEYVAPTAGVHKLIDVLAPGEQVFGDHQVTAWDPSDGSLLPAFPRLMDDLQFLSSPGLFDVSGDGVPDVVQGSGAYLLRAYQADGSTPADWPKFTHGWLIPAPVGGDVDGDGLIEVATFSREGMFFVWDTPAPANEAAIAWQGFGGDRRNTQNIEANVPRTSTGTPLFGLQYQLESIAVDLGDFTAGLTPLNGALVSTLAIGFASLAIDADNAAFAAAMLPFVHKGLAQHPELAALEERLLDALADAAAACVAGADCQGNPACEAKLGTATFYLEVADLMRQIGDHTAAVFLWSRVLVLVH